jgi:hypothetical protein
MAFNETDEHDPVERRTARAASFENLPAAADGNSAALPWPLRTRTGLKGGFQS